MHAISAVASRVFSGTLTAPTRASAIESSIASGTLASDQATVRPPHPAGSSPTASAPPASSSSANVVTSSR